MKEASATTVTTSLEENVANGKVEKKSGKRIGYNYIVLKSLKESQKNDVVTCLYIKSLTNFGICVIKEGSYGDSKDKQGRDIKDRLLWQKQLHQKLQGKIHLPRFLDGFEENGNYYLVLERIKGKSLYRSCKGRTKEIREGLINGNKIGLTFLDYIIQLIILLENLHQNQIVHRDVTATNFMITPSGKVAVIDMELSYSLQDQFPSPPFQLGTYGYMSPEQEATQQPSVEQDTYSAAAIILYIWTGISPIKLTNAPIEEIENKIRFLIPDKTFSEIIIRCLHPDPIKRPILKELRETISLYRTNLKNRINRPTSISQDIPKSEILATVGQAVNTLSTPLLADINKGWFSEKINAPKNPDKRKINKGWYTSFHKGACGVIYMLSKAHLLGINVEATRPFIEKGIELTRIKYINKLDEINPSLYFGSSGIASVLATSINDGLLEGKPEYFQWIDRLLEKDNHILGFQHGLAGQGIANFICAPYLPLGMVKERLNSFVTKLLEVQEKDGSWIRSGKKNRVTRGFANGTAGIIYFLLEYSQKYGHKESLEGAQRALQWMISKAIHKKETVQWRSSTNKEISPWWSEGVTGIALTFIKAWSLLGDTKYKEYAIGSLYNHERNIIYNNISQYSGLSGLGEVYLEAFRSFQSEEWLERANWIAQHIMHLKKQNIHGPYWLVGNEKQPISDFMSGNSGVIHFLLRFCSPDKINFPLLPS